MSEQEDELAILLLKDAGWTSQNLVSNIQRHAVCLDTLSRMASTGEALKERFGEASFAMDLAGCNFQVFKSVEEVQQLVADYNIKGCEVIKPEPFNLEDALES